MSAAQKTRMDVALLLLRSILGVVFVYHGAQKLFGIWGGMGLEGFEGFLASIGVPFAGASAVLVAAIEFFGGLALIAGTGVVFGLARSRFSGHRDPAAAGLCEGRRKGRRGETGRPRAGPSLRAPP